MTPPDSVWMITRDCPPRTSQGCLWSCVWTPINRPSQYAADCIWTSNSQNPQQWRLAPSQPSSIKAIFLENQLHVIINKGFESLNQLSHCERHILQGHPGLYLKKLKKERKKKKQQWHWGYYPWNANHDHSKRTRGKTRKTKMVELTPHTLYQLSCKSSRKYIFILF